MRMKVEKGMESSTHAGLQPKIKSWCATCRSEHGEGKSTAWTKRVSPGKTHGEAPLMNRFRIIRWEAM